MAIENDEFMHECCPEHLHMGMQKTVNMEESKEDTKKINSEGLTIDFSVLVYAREIAIYHNGS